MLRLLLGQQKVHINQQTVLRWSKMVLEILIYIKLIYILYRWLCKRKKIEICGITAYYVSFGIHFVRGSFLLILRKS